MPDTTASVRVWFHGISDPRPSRPATRGIAGVVRRSVFSLCEVVFTFDEEEVVVCTGEPGLKVGLVLGVTVERLGGFG